MTGDGGPTRQVVLRLMIAITLGGVLVWSAILLTRSEPGPAQATQPPASDDELGQRLARCGALGEAALQTPDCRDAWAEHRRRFLGLPVKTDAGGR